MATDFFALSKIFGVVEQPLHWVLAFAIVAALLAAAGRSRAAGRWSIATALLLAVQSWMPIPELLARFLEDAHPRTEFRPGAWRGVLVLGGSIDTRPRSAGREDVMLNGAAERMTKAVELARRDPEMTIVFTGFSAMLRAVGRSEADAARQFFAEQGLPPERIVFEGRSRNTWENAEFSAQLPGVDRSAPWLLLTSATHMPRSMAIFRKAGWNVTPYPTDYRSGSTIDWLDFDPLDAADLWKVTLHEYIGMVAYRLTGKL